MNYIDYVLEGAIIQQLFDQQLINEEEYNALLIWNTKHKDRSRYHQMQENA